MSDFINQDLTFLQPSVIHTSHPKENKTSSQGNTIEISSIGTIENSPLHEQDKDPQLTCSAALDDRSQSINIVAPIQPVEPVKGLTPEEQRKKEEDPNLTLIELLGLQTLDVLYVNQPSRFLPLAQAAQKLAKILKEDEEAAQ